MPFPRRFPQAAIACLSLSLLEIGPARAQAPAADAPATLDLQLMQQAEELFNGGKYSEAAAKYEELVKKFPQVPSVPEANFRAGLAHGVAGEYDEAIAAYKRVIETKNLPPELAQLVELSLSKMPQVLSAKADKLKPEDPKRKPTFEEAVKEFDDYLAKYPTSDEVESATYGKALALFQLGKYDDSIAALRANLAKFTQSPTIQDSQYLLALVLATVGGTEKQKTGGTGPAGTAQFEEAEKLLRDIVARRQNFALMNDAQFQIGELLLAKAQFMTDPAQKKDRADVYAKAIEAYRNVASKDVVVAAQKARIQQFADLRTKYGTAKDKVNYERFKRLVDKETEKLAQVEGSPDMTLTAKIKTGIAYFSQEKWDETRVLFSQLEDLGLLETPPDKKEGLYSITMSYAAQNTVDKAVEKYNAFMGAYKGDPVAENLPLMMGAMYLSQGQRPRQGHPVFQRGHPDVSQGKAARRHGAGPGGSADRAQEIRRSLQGASGYAGRESTQKSRRRRRILSRHD
jgi:tetratricopeptide (TPR) repeat protein